MKTGPEKLQSLRIPVGEDKALIFMQAEDKVGGLGCLIIAPVSTVAAALAAIAARVICIARFMRCLASPQLQAVNRLTLRSSLKSLWLTLWDEDRRKLVSFREALA